MIFTELISKGIRIYVITLPPNEQPTVMKDSKEVITKLKVLGVTIKFRHAMHEKIALIDRRIKWIGSLNILSHNTRKEYMERIEGESATKELFDKFNLDNLLMNQNINGETCPKCNNNYIAVRYSWRNHNYFYSCSGYPECDFTANIRTRTLAELNIKQSITRQQNPKVKTSKSAIKKVKTTDLFGNISDGKQWESPLCYWSSTKLPGYVYSKKKKAWWKKK